MNNLTPFLIIAGSIGTGLMFGLFFVFSNFVMQALGKLPPNYGAATMQSINITIVNNPGASSEAF